MTENVEMTRQDCSLLDVIGALRGLTSAADATLATLFIERGVKVLGRSATFARTACGAMAAGSVKCWGLNNPGSSD